MNKKRMIARAMSLALCGVICGSTLTSLVGCGGGAEKSSIVLMTEELSGLFNPFYATSGTDMDVVGMTQIGMLSTDKNGMPVAGEDHPTVVKDFEIETIGEGDDQETVYTFVLKDDLLFSDGKPLTMNDVMFNIYEYLDPVYTGSSTMYSIKIKGLYEYRTQKSSENSAGADDDIAKSASLHATNRKLELLRIYETKGKVPGSTSSYSYTEEQMKAAINSHTATPGYRAAVSAETKDDAFYRQKLLEDYEFALKTFKEELESDFKAAKESYDLTTMPYSEWKTELSNDVFKFLLYENVIKPKYAKYPEGHPKQGLDNKLKIEKFEGTDVLATYNTKEKAIQKIYNDTVVSEFNKILTQWGTAGTLTTKYTADATSVILHGTNVDGLWRDYIEGVVSLGHMTDVSTVTVNGTPYTVAHEHNEDGTPKNADEYDVLQITVDGIDPKAIYNFGFTVAPAHYYSADDNGVVPESRQIDIKNHKFGVEYASSDFQSKVIQSQKHVEVPVGAGPFKATDANNSDNPSGDTFWTSNVVFFKKNDKFEFPVKADKIRMQVVSSTNALDKLEKGEVDYISPQYSKNNAPRINNLVSKGFKKLLTDQLGYGYIGINAGKIPDVYIRRAIMAAMQPQLATQYYEVGMCQNIDWPMSKVSWAYPKNDDGSYATNSATHTQWTGRAAAEAKIKELMAQADPSASKKIRFTIAGASITEHPTYEVFKQAAEILNDLGWEVEVKADSQALTKLSTGALEVWAAAWGSTIDPDMYQVYHMNSTATSVYAWGYREIKENQTLYSYEYNQIKALSAIIDEARTIDSSTDAGKASRSAKYKEAMSIVLDLAVEMPVYQRQTLWLYNPKTVKGFNDNVNPYSSPLEKIWELELVK
ncbi:MAG: hypothetical protein J6A63_10620 [Clostridia bacterium]|nr:hypothetical protein [Clostridia bacterium]